MNPTIEWKKTQPGSTEAVQFTDGMLVTADDLGAAMRYPLSVIQVLLKAYFGCGIVCGLDVNHPGEGQAAATADGQHGPTPAVPGRPKECDPNYILTVEKGVALGCDGYPIEICGPLKLDLTPDPCRVDRGNKEMFVAARRVTAAEAAARACDCGSTGGETSQQCTRMRDHALVQAFAKDRLPAELCRAVEATDRDKTNPAAPVGELGPGAAAACECLKACGDCACCGEPWVLLGSVMVGTEGLGAVDRSGRRYVKPIACICAASKQEPGPTPGREALTMDDLARRAPQAMMVPEKTPEAAVAAATPPEAALVPEKRAEAAAVAENVPHSAVAAEKARDAPVAADDTNDAPTDAAPTNPAV